MVSTGLQWSLLVSRGLCWYPVVSSGPCRSPVLSTGLCWSPLVSRGLCWSPVVSSGLCRSPVVSTSLCWSPGVSAGLQWSLLVSVASFPGPARVCRFNTVRNSRRGPGLVHHVMCAAGRAFVRHTRYIGRAVLVVEITTNGVGRTWNRSRAYDRLQ